MIVIFVVITAPVDNAAGSNAIIFGANTNPDPSPLNADAVIIPVVLILAVGGRETFCKSEPSPLNADAVIIPVVLALALVPRVILSKLDPSPEYEVAVTTPVTTTPFGNSGAPVPSKS